MTNIDKQRGLMRIRHQISTAATQLGQVPNLMLFRSAQNALVITHYNGEWQAAKFNYDINTQMIWSIDDVTVVNTLTDMISRFGLPTYSGFLGSNLDLNTLLETVIYECFDEMRFWNKEIAPSLVTAFSDDNALREFATRIGRY